MADPRRRLPSVEAVLQEVERSLADSGAASMPARDSTATMVRSRLAALREGAQDGLTVTPTAEELARDVVRDAQRLTGGSLRRVINATGVLLQTNLGRSPLSEAARHRLDVVARGYSNLEYDLDRGRRGERAASLSPVLQALFGAPGLVVNNNAAALVLALTALARGREVVVSRGELIEIGGSFRLPDVMRLSGARLVEVGTTNRTHVADYGDAITARTAMVLKVHLSNFRQVGFVADAGLGDLAAVCRAHGVVMLHDLGSGSVLATEDAGLAHEPTVAESLGAGADLVAFSGDKLLGGPQAGIVVGRADLVRRLGRHPLYRALRPDKLTLGALDATLGAYLRGTAQRELPLWQMLTQSATATRARAEQWAAALRDRAVDPDCCEVVPVESPVGGGSLPGETLPGFGLALRAPRLGATALAARLRAGNPAVVVVVRDGRVVLDPRSVAEGAEDHELVNALVAVMR